MQNEHPPNDQQKLSPPKIVSHAGLVVEAIVLVCVLALLLFHDSLVNRFIKPRIIKAFTEAYPAYLIHITNMHYNVLKNSFGFDFVTLSSADSSFLGNVGPFSVSGIGWIHLLWGGKLEPKDFANVDLEAQDIVLNFLQSHYKLRCQRLSVSVPDSVILVETLRLHPPGDDEHFFAGSKFRTTRFRFVVPHVRVMGFACLELLKGKMYRTRSVQVHDVFLDILVNKDKPDSKDTLGPFMPNEILSSIKETLRIDSFSIMNGQLKYGERFAVGSKPAWITFDNMQVLAEGIANHGDPSAALVIRAQGKFAKAGTINVLMTIPVASKEFSFKYSGSLSRMDLSPINSFLEVSDQMRIKTGVLEEATFEVNVASGRASGYLRGVYSNFTLAAIDKKTGSEKGLSNSIVSFIANAFKVRRNNVPGSMKIGKVKYTRQPDDPFIQFTWFALRTAVRDVVGF